MIDLLITLAIIIVPLVLSGLLSASETAITALSQAKIHKLKTDGNKRAKVISDLREEKEKLISTILLANNACNIIASALATAFLIKIYGGEGVIYATILMTTLTIVFSEVFPKTYAIAYPEKVALSLAYLLKNAVIICGPITHTINKVVAFMLKIFSMTNAQQELVSPTEEIRETIEMHHKLGAVAHKDKYMLDGVFYLSETAVEQVMTHRTNMQTINIDLDTQEILTLIKEISHTRIPVWKDKSDNIIGILNTRDLLDSLLTEHDLDKINITSLLSSPVFIHENTTLDKQLSSFKEHKNRFAVVIDEYGDIQGVITLFDILSELVGDIQDEHDNETPEEDIIYLNGVCTTKGEVAIRDINRKLHWNLPEEDASTIAGLLIHKAEVIPNVGEQLKIDRFIFTVLAKQENQLTSIKIEKII